MSNVPTRRSIPGLPNTAACLLFVALHLVFSARVVRAGYDITVAQDGSGDYTSVQAAISAVPDSSVTRTTIYIKAGSYREKLDVPKSKGRVTLIGEDRDSTIVTYDDHATINADYTVTGTADTPTVNIRAEDFAASNVTFANTAGNVGPALAVWVQGNRAHFRNCAFLGYQDTLCTFGKLAYFNRCYIEGAIDFIFGDSTAVFRHCTIHCIGIGYITAADTSEDASYGFVFRGCKIYGDAPAGMVYLGRAWGENAKVVFANCSMDEEIAPEAWDDWDDPDADNDTFFAEYDSTGAGADPDDRAAWSHQLTSNEIGDYTLEKIFHLPDAPTDTPMLLEVSLPWYADY